MNKISRSTFGLALCFFCCFWCVVGFEIYLSYTFGPDLVPAPMVQVSYHIAPGELACVIIWSSVMAAIIWAISRTFSFSAHMKRLLLYNILIVAFYFGLSVWEWHTNNPWIGILSMTWLVTFYFASFFALRKRVSHAALLSLGAAFVTTTAYFVLLLLSAPFVDPSF